MMRSETRKKITNIFGYPFFQSVGGPLPQSVKPVKTWRDATKECCSKKWENCRLIASNALFDQVQRKSWERGQEWNPLAEELRPMIVKFVETLVPKIPV